VARAGSFGSGVVVVEVAAAAKAKRASGLVARGELVGGCRVDAAGREGTDRSKAEAVDEEDAEEVLASAGNAAEDEEVDSCWPRSESAASADSAGNDMADNGAVKEAEVVVVVVAVVMVGVVVVVVAVAAGVVVGGSRVANEALVPVIRERPR